MAISYQAALRLYAKQKGGFVIPKKGSADYDAVKKLMGETEDAPEHATKKRMSKKAKAMMSEKLPMPEEKAKVRKAMKAKKQGAAEALKVVAETHEPVTKAKKAPTRKGDAAPEVTRNADPLVPPAAGTKPLEAAGGAGSRAQLTKSEEPVVKEKLKKAAPKRRGVKSSGLTQGVATQEFLVNDNVMGGGAASAQLPGQKERLKKTLKKQEGETSIVTVGSGDLEPTLDGMKTDDPKAISGKAPFSIQSLRNRLLC